MVKIKARLGHYSLGKDKGGKSQGWEEASIAAISARHCYLRSRRRIIIRMIIISRKLAKHKYAQEKSLEKLEGCY